MFKKLLTRTLVTAMVAATASTAFAADATNWPTRPIQVVVPAGAGGDTDFNARTMAKYFSQITGKSMVVTNMGGGGGTIAVSHVQGSNPDGNTIFFGHTGQLVVNEVAGLADYSYDVLDIACIAAVDKGAVFVSSKASGIKDVKDLVDKAKAAPGTMNYGTYGNATSSHMNGERFKQQAGIDLTHIPYQGSGPEMAALLGGQLTLAFVDATAAYPHIKSDKINILAITGAQRHPALPQVPTMTEAGYPGLEANGWFGMFVPATTPKAIVDKLGSEVSSIVKSPELNKRLTEMGLIPVGSLPDDFKAQIDKDAAHWKAVAEAAKISMD